MAGPKNKVGFLAVHIWPKHDGHNVALAFVESIDGQPEPDEFVLINLDPSQARVLADMLKSAANCEDDTVEISMSTIPFEVRS